MHECFDIIVWCIAGECSWPLFNATSIKKHDETYADPEGRQGTGPPPPLENHKWLYVSLEVLIRSPLKKLLETLGPIASRGKVVLPSVKFVVETKKHSCRDPTDAIFWIRPCKVTQV